MLARSLLFSSSPLLFTSRQLFVYRARCTIIAIYAVSSLSDHRNVVSTRSKKQSKCPVRSCETLLTVVAFQFGAEFRRFELDRKNPIKYDDFHRLIEELHHLQNIPFHITYLDKDGELLSINNDSIIEHILRVSTGLLRIFVQRKGTNVTINPSRTHTHTLSLPPLLFR